MAPNGSTTRAAPNQYYTPNFREDYEQRKERRTKPTFVSGTHGSLDPSLQVQDVLVAHDDPDPLQGFRLEFRDLPGDLPDGCWGWRLLDREAGRVISVPEGRVDQSHENDVP